MVGDVHIRVRVYTWRLRAVLWVARGLVTMIPFASAHRLVHWLLKHADKWVTVKVR